MNAPEPTPDKRVPPPAIQTAFFVKAENGGQPEQPRKGSGLAPVSVQDSRQVLSRLAIGVLLAGAIVLTWWSLTKVLGPRQQEVRELGSRVAQLSAQVEDLDRNWSREKAVRVNDSFGEIHSDLFAGRPGLEAWAAGLKDQVEALGLGLQTDFGVPAVMATNGQRVVAVPATLTVDVRTAAAANLPSPYQRILLLSQHLTADEKRADLNELTVVGGTNSIGRAVLGLSLWASEGGDK
ncbi:MAG: hypothetical protein DME25_02460 [Verrucomicrobia bacterium]|nr:MAG: hypothetical protein DME25_02460 [Verrucomicrobiota bacterium]